MVRVTVFGGWFGSGNVGDDAILTGLVNLLTSLDPDVEVVALSTDPAQTRRVCGVEAIRLLSPRGFIRGDKNALRAYRRAFKDADACIVTGGTPIYDYGHLSRCIHFKLPGAFGRKLFLLGVGVKRIKSRLGREVTRALVGGAELVSTRDEASRGELFRLGVGRPVRVTGDSGLFMEPSDPSIGLGLLQDRGVDTSGRMVAVCPRELSEDFRVHYHERLTRRAIYNIRRNVAGVVDCLVESGCEVVFVPMHCSPQDDDLREIEAIRRLMRNRDAGAVLGEVLPREAMSVLGVMDLVLGLRLHSLILAGAQGVPVVGIGHDPKIGGFMEEAGVGGFLCHPLYPFECVLERVESALEDGATLEGRLLESCEGMKERIRDEARRVLASI